MDRLFLNPASLWLLTLSAAILSLYLLRLKRRRVEVSSTLLWTQALEEFQANVPFQWLKKNLLLLLQLLLFLLLVLGLSRPYFKGKVSAGRKTVIIVDTSYSMLARDGGKTRLDRAMERARELAGGIARGDQAMIVAMNHRPEALTGFTPDKADLNKAVGGLKDRLGGRADLAAALKILGPMLSSGVRIAVVSDGGFDDGGGYELPPQVSLEYFPVGRPVYNAGISAISLSKEIGGDGFELFAAISSTFPQSVERTLRLTSGDYVIDQRTVQLPAGGRTELTIAPIPEADEPLELSLVGGDDFPPDDECTIVQPPKTRIDVTLVSKPDVILESALAIDADIDVSRVESGAAGGGVFIWNGVQPPDGFSSPSLVLNPGAPVFGIVPGEKVERPRVVDWDVNHPVLRFVNPANLVFSSSRAARTGSGSSVIVEGSGGPLVVAGEADFTRFIATLFDPSESDFPFRPSFPIFLHNSIVWLSKTAQGADPYNASVGKPWKFKVPEDASIAVLRDPSGREYSLVPKGGEIGGVELNKLGIWRLTVGSATELIAVNLADDEESKLEFREAFRAGETTVVGGKKARANREIWGFLIFCALVLLLGEWYVFHRRGI
ncbi:MAG: VWA domain-containing protein [bacterium]